MGARAFGNRKIAILESEKIIELLPYDEPFLFVDGLNSISNGGVEGHYTFRKEAYIYQGHFKGNPVTPGVIISECMAQIGVVCLGIYLLDKDNISASKSFVLSNMDIDFFKPVFPDERVRVASEKIYFRFNKLKCRVKMWDSQNQLVAKGTISGMILENKSTEI